MNAIDCDYEPTIEEAAELAATATAGYWTEPVPDLVELIEGDGPPATTQPDDESN